MMIILISTCFYSWLPKLDNKNFMTIISVVLRVIPYMLFVLFCRVGIFFIMGPSAINDDNKILELLVSSSFAGLIGVIPEIFIGMCVLFEVGYEYLINWVEKKVMASSRLSRWFGLNKKSK